MLPKQLVERVIVDVQRHCRNAKGYEEGPWVNPLVPHDCVAALAMARWLVEKGAFDHCVAVAPEGHLYGYFFEKLGIPVLSVHVDYPPRCFKALDDLSVLRGGRILLLEDDVISGVTLRLVTTALEEYGPQSLALYLGRAKDDQILESVGTKVGAIYLAEDCLDPALREQYEVDFSHFFRDLDPDS
ncbi:MAG: hypothetical protein ACLQNE_18570 [Thermoguttaceae bacterium]